MKQAPAEKKDKRRGRMIALFFHSIIIALAVIPFMSHKAQEELILEDGVQIMLFDFSQREGVSAEASPEPEAETVQKAPAPAEAEQFEVEPLPVPEVVLSESPEPVVLEEAKVPVEKKVEEAETAVVDAVKADRSSHSKSDVLVRPNSGGNQNGGSTSAGDKNEKAGEGKGSKSDGFDLSGSGILTRKVIYRASLENIIRQNGTFVVNICVNRSGNVTAAKYNPEGSTITEPNLVRKAMDAATKYKFERDATAPPQQCGRMTFVIKGIQ
ncbi:MAG: hypothetical protein K9I85_03830 [Saprospiraceae bacterium]|nr:hypothetical protein [Saprospiraceae bacterium]